MAGKFQLPGDRRKGRDGEGKLLFGGNPSMKLSSPNINLWTLHSRGHVMNFAVGRNIAGIDPQMWASHSRKVVVCFIHACYDRQNPVCWREVHGRCGGNTKESICWLSTCWRHPSQLGDGRAGKIMICVLNSSDRRAGKLISGRPEHADYKFSSWTFSMLGVMTLMLTASKSLLKGAG